MSRRNTRSILIAAALASLGAACSSATDPGTNSATKSLSATEAGAVASGIFTQVLKALSTSGSASRAALFDRAPAAGATAARAAVAATTVNFSGPCQLGGAVSGSESFSDNLDANGTGTETGTITFTPKGCVVSTGSRNVTVDGDPSLTMTFSVPVTAGTPSGGTFKVSGGFRWTGGGCQMNYTVTATQAGKATVSGTVCGQDVSGTY